MRFWTLLVVALVCQATAFAQEEVVEVIQEPRTKLEPSPAVSIAANSLTDLFRYEYSVSISAGSEQKLVAFRLLTTIEPTQLESPSNWVPGFDSQFMVPRPPRVAWIARNAEDVLPQGETLTGLVIHSRALPGITEARSSGFAPLPSFPEGVPRLKVTPEQLPDDQMWVKQKTVGPVVLPTEPFNPIEVIDHMVGQVPAAAELGWLIDPSAVDSKLQAARASLVSGNATEAAIQLRALSEDLDSGRGETVTEEGFWLLSATIEFVIAKVAPDRPTTWFSNRDTFLRLRDLHLNEGANPSLILKKVQGKTTRALVGFDLDGLDLTGLVSATLVLNIDPAVSPTGWGNGRTVSAIPINEEWVEGNGRDLEVAAGQQTLGSGTGATWFSARDPDISNNSPDSAINWDGAGLAAEAQTAPPITVQNHQTGEVAFAVTQDVLAGKQDWMIVRNEENVGSKVHFFSKEGGGAELGPRLLLDYGSGSAAAGDKNRALAGISKTRLVKNVPDFESSIQYAINPHLVMAAGQEFLAFAFRGQPFAEVLTRLFIGGWQAGLV